MFVAVGLVIPQQLHVVLMAFSLGRLDIIKQHLIVFGPPLSMPRSNSTDGGRMTKVFVLSTTTPLLFDFWKPRNAGDYAGTCIFLVVFAAATRVLFAIRSTVEHTGSERARRRHDQGYRRQPRQEYEQVQEEDAEGATGPRTENGWDWRNDLWWESRSLLPRLAWAASETVLAGLGYLL